MEFTTWPILATNAGATGMVLLITEFTKSLPGIKKMPTQLWSYILAFAILMLSNLFIGELTLESAVLVLFNAVVVALAANGSYSAIIRSSAKKAQAIEPEAPAATMAASATDDNGNAS